MTTLPIHEETDIIQFRDPNQPNLHTVYWTRKPIDQKPSANLLFWIHGHGEHSAWYKSFAARILDTVPELDAVLSYDLRNHGESQGNLGVVQSIEQLIDDAHDHVLPRMAIRYGPNARVILGGHSLGGLIAASLATRPDFLQRDDCGKLVGVVLSAPAIEIFVHGTVNRVLVPVSGLFASLPGTRTMLRHRGFTGEALTHDTDYVNSKLEDKKVFEQVSVGLATDMLSCGTKLIGKINKDADMLFCANIPVLVLHGTEDSVTKVEGSRKLVKRLSETGKCSVELKEIKGAYHEIHNELEDNGRKLFFEHISSFLKTSLPK